MSVKHGLLALLSQGPSTTYQLKKDFDRTTSQTWPVNIGQVSTTLQRLARDGLVCAETAVGTDEAEAGVNLWHLTATGREEVARWWTSPVSRTARSRDELVVKLALAVHVPGVDITMVVQRQRSALQRTLHDVTRARRTVDPDDVAARLVLDSHIFATEAELRWLDVVEGEAARDATTTRRTTPTHRSATDLPTTRSTEVTS